MTARSATAWAKAVLFHVESGAKAVKGWALGSGLREGCDVGGHQRRFSGVQPGLRRSGVQVREEGRPTLRALGGEKWNHILVKQPVVLMVTRGNKQFS